MALSVVEGKTVTSSAHSNSRQVIVLYLKEKGGERLL